jgi:hypothetical protein
MGAPCGRADNKPAIEAGTIRKMRVDNGIQLFRGKRIKDYKETSGQSTPQIVRYSVFPAANRRSFLSSMCQLASHVFGRAIALVPGVR